MTATAIGIDVGGTNVRAAAVDAEGRILARAAGPSSPDPRAVLDRCVALARAVSGHGAVAVGVGVPGQVIPDTRRVLSGGFVDLSGIDFAGELEAALGLPVTIENDATMALLGEAGFGAARGVATVVMLTIGTGIGGAILDRGRIVRGRGVAGQLGHLVVATEGRACVCGRRGCVETESSGTAFARHLAEAGLPAGTRAQDLLARPDDPTAARVLRAWAAPLRAAIDTLVAALNPERVVIGGGAGAAAVAALSVVPEPPSWFKTEIVAASLGDDAGAIGAARAALRARAPGKRAVLVNGVPASGKSAVARALSDATGWPVLGLDLIKDPFLDRLGPVDREGNRTLGRASYAAMFALIAAAPAGATFVLDAWFGFRPLEELEAGLAAAGVTETLELWCAAPPEVVGARYLARVDARPVGHPGADYVPELEALAARAAPTDRGPTLRLATDAPVDVGAALDWIAARWPDAAR